MARGVLIAVLVSALWMICQIIAMHIRPASNRFKAMAASYLLSLPLIPLAYVYLPSPRAAGEAEWMTLFHACLFHLLLFFFYVQLFYHVERSVTLRFLVELLKRHGQPVSLHGIRQEYSLRQMIEARLESLAGNEFIEKAGNRWRNKAKGNMIAAVMRVSSWVFQSRSQKDRG
jgi:hypothetical protein